MLYMKWALLHKLGMDHDVMLNLWKGCQMQNDESYCVRVYMEFDF